MIIKRFIWKYFKRPWWRLQYVFIQGLVNHTPFGFKDSDLYSEVLHIHNSKGEQAAKEFVESWLLEFLRRGQPLTWLPGYTWRAMCGYLSGAIEGIPEEDSDYFDYMSTKYGSDLYWFMSTNF